MLLSVADTVEPFYKERTLGIRDTSNEETVCSPNNIELCTNLPLH